jgi:hypothetical protein
MIVEGVLREELRNSRQIKKKYEERLEKLPKGCLVKKNIKGHDYYYIAQRRGEKVIFIYANNLPQNKINEYKEAKKVKKKYKRLLSDVKKEIKYIKKVLPSHG